MWERAPLNFRILTTQDTGSDLPINIRTWYLEANGTLLTSTRFAVDYLKRVEPDRSDNPSESAQAFLLVFRIVEPRSVRLCASINTADMEARRLHLFDATERERSGA